MINMKYMILALEEAKERKGFCAPNPSVGAVLVSEGNNGHKILTSGQHFQAGLAHAEVDAINQAKDLFSDLDLFKNSTLYVTLEPCCHTGRTPPCTDLIIKSGIKKVIFSYLDPNPQVSGQGMRKLQENGIICEHIPLKEIDTFYQSYSYFCKFKKPFVTFKLALSSNNMYAFSGGIRARITGDECNLLTHYSRLHADAILTSSQTVLCDDPKLNVRYPDNTHAISKNLFVVDRNNKLCGNEQIFKTMNVTLLSEPNLNRILEHLGELGIQDLWVEAGGRLLKSFIQENCVNRIILYRCKQDLPRCAEYYFDPKIITGHIYQSYQLGCDRVEEIECLQE